MRRVFPIRPGILALVAAVAFPMAVQAQQGADEEWSVYGGGPGHTRYSALDQIDASNVAELEVAWRWTGRNFGPNPFAGNQTTPLMVGGMLYAILRDWEPEKWVQFGWATGALVTTLLQDYAQPADEDQIWSIWEGNARVKR